MLISFESLKLKLNTKGHGYNGKAISLKTWRGPEGSRRLRLHISRQLAHEGGKVVCPTHRPPLPQEIFLVLISVRG
jgi:hypothetical protein